MSYNYLNNRNKVFLIAYILILLVLFYPIFFNDKLQLIQRFNLPKTNFLLTLFRFLTSLAEGIFVTLIILYLATKKIKYALAVLFSVVLSGVFAQFFKRVIFENQHRPFYYLKQSNELNWMELHEKIEMLSFPSGHTTTAFALFFVLIFITQSIGLKIFLFISMFFIAYSRVYLYQHFHRDIFAGSFLGTIFSLLSLPILNTQNPALQKPVTAFFKINKKS